MLRYNGNEANPTGKLFVGTYDEADSEIMLDAKSYDIKGTTAEGLDYIKPGKGTVRLYIWDGVDSLNPLSGGIKAGGYSSADFLLRPQHRNRQQNLLLYRQQHQQPRLQQRQPWFHTIKGGSYTK